MADSTCQRTSTAPIAASRSMARGRDPSQLDINPADRDSDPFAEGEMMGISTSCYAERHHDRRLPTGQRFACIAGLDRDNKSSENLNTASQPTRAGIGSLRPLRSLRETSGLRVSGRSKEVVRPIIASRPEQTSRSRRTRATSDSDSGLRSNPADRMDSAAQQARKRSPRRGGASTSTPSARRSPAASRTSVESAGLRVGVGPGRFDVEGRSARPRSLTAADSAAPRRAAGLARRARAERAARSCPPA
jgi:hypothetical protein